MERIQSKSIGLELATLKKVIISLPGSMRSISIDEPNSIFYGVGGCRFTVDGNGDLQDMNASVFMVTRIRYFNGQLDNKSNQWGGD
ncbi:hypothetical protein OH492_25715 [Vibrio chagasii]|nr:hypothetical protein [Vibrio chagasii]